MLVPNAKMLREAIELVDGADHLLANTTFESQLDSRDCYDLAEKLERASYLLHIVGNRKRQDELNEIPLPTDGVPF